MSDVRFAKKPRNLSIPDGWDALALQDIAEPDAPIRYGVVQIGPNTEGGVPIVPIKYIDKIASSPLRRASSEIEIQYSGSRIRGGDILLSIKGTIGAVGVVPKGFCGNIAREIARIRPTPKYDPAFVALQLIAGETQRRIDRLTVGSTRREFSIHAVRKFFLHFPPLSEQQAIADLLSTWDKAIEKIERLVQAKEKRFKWLLRELISEPRMDTDKHGWRKVKLGEIGEISSAGVDKKINHNEVSVRLLNYLDVYRRDFVYSQELTHEVTAPKLNAKKCDIRKGDIFFTPSSEVRDDVAHSAVAMEDIPNGVYSYHIVRLRLHENIDLLYRAYAFKSSDYYKQAYKYCDGSGQRYVISQSNFRKIEILLPPLETQRKIAETLYLAQQEINLLKRLADKYKTQKRGLMQKMLTGEWRVKPEIVNQYMES